MKSSPTKGQLAQAHRKDLIKRAVQLGYKGKKTRPNAIYEAYIVRYAKGKVSRQSLYAKAKKLGYSGAYKTATSAMLKAFIEGKQQEPPKKKARLDPVIKPSASAPDPVPDEKEDEKESKKSHPSGFNEMYYQALAPITLQSLHGQVQKHKSFLSSIVKQKVLLPAAEHAIEMCFDIKYDFKELTITSISAELTNLLTEAIHGHWKQFSVKIIIYGDLLNMITGERILDFPWPFPRDSVFTIRTAEDRLRLGRNLYSFVRHFHMSSEIYPSTQWRYEFITGFGYKIFKHETGGCAGKSTAHPFGVSVKNPDNKDDLCFWRCLAIKLYSDEHVGIRKKDSKLQREKAQYLRDRAEWKADHVALVDVPHIARALRLNIETNSLNDEDELINEWQEQDVKKFNPGAKHLGSSLSEPIQLLWQAPTGKHPHGHYMLINTKIGIGVGVKCRQCGMVLKHTKKNAKRALKRHNRKHHNEQASSKQTLQFRKGLITPKQSALTQILKVPAQCDMYLAYDFESMLVKQPYKKEVTSSVKFTQRHDPIGVVAKAWGGGELDLDLHYKGASAAVQFVKHLDTVAPIIKRWKIKQLWKKYKLQLKTLEKGICRCESKSFLHAGYCRKATGETPEPKCSGCTPRKKHVKGCEYMKQKARVEAEYCRVPVVGFNSGRYDMTFVVNAMNDSTGEIKSMINKGSGYMSLRYDIYEFIDARNFVPPNVSLSKFAQMWGVRSIEKGEFPYAWLDDEKKLEAREFPAREHFYNDLSKEELPQVRYEAAKAVFEAQCSTMGEYMMLYCEKDVDLLIRGLNNYRSLVQEEMKIELLDYISLPQFVYASLLSTYIDQKKHPVKYIPDEKSFRIITDSCYGGGCQVFTRYANVEAEDELIVSVDENNLYGHSMCHLLPFGDPVAFDSMGRRCEDVLEKFHRVSTTARSKPMETRYSFLALHNQTDVPPADPYGFNGFMRVHLSLPALPSAA